MASRRLIIAIDGPSGAGKGTVARTIAARLGYRHVDTGAMYRAVAWLALDRGLDLQHEADVEALAAAATFEVNSVTRIDGRDVTDAIRTPDIDKAAAVVARHPRVRAVLVARQREYGRQGGVVMEGRDIGSVVFPAAEVKVYLDASPEERARRRAADTAHAIGRQGAGLDTVVDAMASRDALDQTRAVSPLTRAQDAVYLDTTGVPLEQVVDRVMGLVDACLGQRE